METDRERLEWEAAWTLFGIKITKFDEEIVCNLNKASVEDMARNHQHSHSHQESPPLPRGPPLSNAVIRPPMNEDPYAAPLLPPLPPVQVLQGVIANCSVPFEKQLTMSDTLPNQGRLTISNEHFTKNLKPMLVVSEKLGDGIDVVTYNVEGRQYKMKFKLWAGKMVVLTSGWQKFVSDHDLKQGEDIVTVWMFRCSNMEGLYFAITSRRVHGLQEQIKKPKRKRKGEQPSNGSKP